MADLIQQELFVPEASPAGAEHKRVMRITAEIVFAQSEAREDGTVGLEPLTGAGTVTIDEVAIKLPFGLVVLVDPEQGSDYVSIHSVGHPDDPTAPALAQTLSKALIEAGVKLL